MQTMQSNLFYCKITPRVSGDTAPIIRNAKSVTAASGTGHTIGPATSFQCGQVGTGPDLAETCRVILQ